MGVVGIRGIVGKLLPFLLGGDGVLAPWALSVFCLIGLLPTAGYAVFIECPFDVLLRGDCLRGLHVKRQFFNVVVDNGGADANVSLNLLRQAQRGYVRLVTSSDSPPVQQGDLTVFIVVLDQQGEEPEPSPREVSLGLFSSEWERSPDQLFQGGNLTRNMAGFIGGFPRYYHPGERVSLPATGEEEGEIPFGQFIRSALQRHNFEYVTRQAHITLSLPPNQGAKVFSFGFTDVDRESIQFANINLKVGDTDIPLGYSQSTDIAPDRDTLVVLLYHGDEGGDEDGIGTYELHAHALRAKGKPESVEQRTLTTADLRNISLLITFGQVSSLAQMVDIDESVIAGIRSEYVDNLQEGRFQLLKQMKDRKTNFTAEYMAELLARNNQRALAEKVRSGDLQFSIEDRQLQKEMRVAGGWLDSVAAELAVMVGIDGEDLQKIKSEPSPGYQLLSVAYRTDKLSHIYPATKKTAMNLWDFRRQIEEGDRFPWLQVLLSQEGGPARNDQPLAILPFRVEHIDPVLLRVPMTSTCLDGYQLAADGREGYPCLSPASVIRIGNKLSVAAGCGPMFTERHGFRLSVLCSDAQVRAFQYRQGLSTTPQSWLNWGGLLGLINKARDLECNGLGSKMLAALESGALEKALPVDTFAGLAAEYFVLGEQRKAFSLLAAALQKKSTMRLQPGVAHMLGLQCSLDRCPPNSSNGGAKQCAQWPTLRQKIRALGVRPYIFSYRGSVRGRPPLTGVLGRTAGNTPSKPVNSVSSSVAD